MKEQYISQVLRALPRSRRAAVRRDLEEIFSGAQARGESEAQVLERLGPPADFARGAAPATRPRRGNAIGFALCSAAAVLILGASAAAQIGRSRFPADAIGGAEGMTGIRVEGSFDALPLLWVLGALALAAAIALGVRLWRARRTEGGGEE